MSDELSSEVKRREVNRPTIMKESWTRGVVGGFGDFVTKGVDKATKPPKGSKGLRHMVKRIKA